MKIAHAIVALAFAIVATAASAAVLKPTTISKLDGVTVAATFDPSQIQTGAAMNLGVIDTAGFKTLDCKFKTFNEAGGASRLIIPTAVRGDETTVFTYATTTLATNSEVRLIWDPTPIPTATLPENTTHYPVVLDRFMVFKAAAANGDLRAECALRK